MPTAVLLPDLTGVAEAMSWIDADGSEHMLDGSAGVYVGEGKSGRWAPPVEQALASLAFSDGSRITGTFIRARKLDIPLVSVASGVLATRQLARVVQGWFDPRRDGSLRVYSPDGTIREITGRPSLEVAEGTIMEQSPDHHMMVLTLTAADPYWQDASDTTQTYTIADVPSSLVFKSPFFPFRVVTSEVLAYTLIVNGGNGDAWPVWTIDGPVINPAVRNFTTGKLLALTRSILSGERVIVDTRPGQKTVRDAGSSNLFASLNAGAEMWPFTVGTNAIQVEGQAATTATLITLAYRERHYGP